MKIQKKKIIFASVLIAFAAVFISAYFYFSPYYPNKEVHTGDIILSGNDELIVEDTKFIQQGNIELSGNARLVFRRSMLVLDNIYADAWGLEARDQAQFIFEDSTFETRGWLDFNFYNNSKALYKNTRVRGSKFGPWHGFFDSASLEADNAYFGGTANQEVIWNIKNSPGIFLELGIADATADETGLKKGFIDSWSFPNRGEEGINYKITVENSTALNWGSFVAAEGKLTLRDSEPFVICLPIGDPYINETVHLSDLRPGLFEDRIIEYLDTRLRLVDTSVERWCLSTWNENTLYVTDAVIDDIRHNGGNSRQFYERIVAEVAVGEESAQIEIKNSKIKGDVTAKDNSVIVLINTEVGGSIYEEGGGKVIVK